MKIKRWLFAAAAVAVAIALAGCPGTGGPQETPEPPPGAVRTTVFDMENDPVFQALAFGEISSTDLGGFEGSPFQGAGATFTIVPHPDDATRRALQVDSAADNWRGLDLPNARVGFAVGDEISIAGFLVTEGQPTFNVDVAAWTPLQGWNPQLAAGAEFENEFTPLTAAEVIAIRNNTAHDAPSPLRFVLGNPNRVAVITDLTIVGLRDGVTPPSCNCDDNECLTDGECACYDTGDCGLDCNCEIPVELPPGHIDILDRLSHGSGGFLAIDAAAGVPSAVKVTTTPETGSPEFVELRLGSSGSSHGLDLLLGTHTAAAFDDVVSLQAAGLVTIGQTYTVTATGRVGEGAEGVSFWITRFDAGAPQADVRSEATDLDADDTFDISLDFTPDGTNAHSRVRLMINDSSTTLILTSVVVKNAAGAVVWDMAEVLMCEYGGMVPCDTCGDFPCECGVPTIAVAAQVGNLYSGVASSATFALTGHSLPEDIITGVLANANVTPLPTGVTAGGTITVTPEGTLTGNLTLTTAATAVAGITSNVTVTLGTGANAVTSPAFTVTITQSTWGIELDVPDEGLMFPSELYGYDPVAAVTVGIENTGNQPTGVLSITLEGDDDSFVLSVAEIASIAPGATATFTIRPADDLDEGEHEATVTVAGTGVAASISENFDVSFEVLDPYSPLLTIVTADIDGQFQQGIAGEVSIPITGANMGAAGTVAFSAAGVVTSLPAGITASGDFTIVADGSGTGTLVLAGTPAATATSIVVTVTIREAAAVSTTLDVLAAPSVTVVHYEGTMVDGEGGVVTFTVTGSNVVSLVSGSFTPAMVGPTIPSGVEVGGAFTVTGGTLAGTLTLTGNNTVAEGMHNLTLTLGGAPPAPFTLNIEGDSAPDITLIGAPGTVDRADVNIVLGEAVGMATLIAGDHFAAVGAAEMGTRSGYVFVYDIDGNNSGLRILPAALANLQTGDILRATGRTTGSVSDSRLELRRLNALASNVSGNEGVAPGSPWSIPGVAFTFNRVLLAEDITYGLAIAANTWGGPGRPNDFAFSIDDLIIFRPAPPDGVMTTVFTLASLIAAEGITVGEFTPVGPLTVDGSATVVTWVENPAGGISLQQTGRTENHHGINIATAGLVQPGDTVTVTGRTFLATGGNGAMELQGIQHFFPSGEDVTFNYSVTWTAGDPVPASPRVTANRWSGAAVVDGFIIDTIVIQGYRVPD